MAMGRWRGERQGTLFIEAERLARPEGRTFYSALNEILSGHGFDRFCEEKVATAKVFDEELGRPSIPPGVYFRMLLVGYFEGVASERGVAWRCADSLSLREFLGYELTETTPDHSTLSGLRRKLGLPLHRAVFDWVLDVAAREASSGWWRGGSATLERRPESPASWMPRGSPRRSSRTILRN